VCVNGVGYLIESGCFVLGGLLLGVDNKEELKDRKREITTTSTCVIIRLGDAAVLDLELSNLLGAFAEVVRMKEGKMLEVKEGLGVYSKATCVEFHWLLVAALCAYQMVLCKFHETHREWTKVKGYSGILMKSMGSKGKDQNHTCKGWANGDPLTLNLHLPHPQEMPVSLLNFKRHWLKGPAAPEMYLLTLAHCVFVDVAVSSGDVAMWLMTPFAWQKQWWAGWRYGYRGWSRSRSRSRVPPYTWSMPQWTQHMILVDLPSCHSVRSAGYLFHVGDDVPTLVEGIKIHIVATQHSDEEMDPWEAIIEDLAAQVPTPLQPGMDTNFQHSLVTNPETDLSLWWSGDCGFAKTKD
jgi:hypothetical protein